MTRIRTPLNAIIGATGLLRETPLNERQREYVDMARLSGGVLLDLINDILDFSKIEAGRLELESQTFDLRACVEESLDLVATRAGKGPATRVSVRARLPVNFIGDTARLRQVLVNLLSNAVKFTARGEIVAEVTARAARGSDYQIQIAVRDTGIGIPADRQDRLFQVFTQVDTSTTRVFGGTGLGLAICKRLVEAMGGGISVESVVGAGSTFRVVLPLQAAKDDPASNQRTATDIGRITGRRVLIVDTNAATRRMLSLCCESWGVEAVEIDSAAGALEQLRSGRLRLHPPRLHVAQDLDGPALGAQDRSARTEARPCDTADDPSPFSTQRQHGTQPGPGPAHRVDQARPSIAAVRCSRRRPVTAPAGTLPSHQSRGTSASLRPCASCWPKTTS